jgi:elongation factor P--beta-lysine ligase
MYLYNITINIDETVQQKWLKWMKEVHIPKMLATGKFTKALMSRVMVNEEMGGVTYAVQYYVRSKEVLDEYYKDDAKKLDAEIHKLFAGKFVDFNTELEIINEFKPKN